MKRSTRLLAAVLAAACSCLHAHAAPPLDLDSDGMPDVWAIVHGAAGLNMSADTDGDGQSNAAEAIAGTDPRSPSGTNRISSIHRDIYGMHVAFPVEAGKRYTVQSKASLETTTWTDETPFTAQTTGEHVADFADAAGGKFFRVSVADVDTDGDGVNDWEELQLGFDPNTKYSGGSNGPTDLVAITSALTQPSTVSVVSIDNLATEPAAGVQPSDTGAFILSRTGGLKPITVTFNSNGSAATSGSDYVSIGTSIAMGLGVRTATIAVVPRTDSFVESPEAVILNVVANAAYTVGAPSSAGVVIGDYVQTGGTGLRASFYNEATTMDPSGTIPPGAAPTWANLRTTRIDPVIDYDWSGNTPGVGSPSPDVNVNYFASRWVGEVLPEFSQIYTFSVEHNRCARLWVNGRLLVDKWPGNGNTGNNASATTTGTIELSAGVRYPILLEHFDTTGDGEMHLRWQSANQPLQLIPTARMFADTAPQIVGERNLFFIKDSPAASYQIAASGFPTSYSAANLPPGWTLNTATGLIGLDTSTAGEWDVVVSATNAAGTGSATIRVTILAAGGGIARDVWPGVTGTSVASIPVGTNPPETGTVAALDGPLNAADNYGARLRGYITAPTTGIYKFWLSGSDAAELWIGDDDQPVNTFLRASIAGPTGHRDWANVPPSGRTALLHLNAGQRYFVQVLHKAGVGTDHVSVGWLKPGEGGVDPSNAPAASELVPAYVLSPYVPPAAAEGESTIYTTNMRAQGAAVTNGFGGASLRLSADERQAILSYTYGNLTTPVTAQHIHSDAFDGHMQGEIIFDIDAAEPQPDGSYVWDIEPVGTFTDPQQLVDAIKGGYSYINVHTVQYGPGEIRGNFKLAAASQTFTPPLPPPAAAPAVPASDNDAARFLIQATFGPSETDIAALRAMPNYEAWIDDQIANKGMSSLYAFAFANRNQSSGQGNTWPGTLTFNAWWRTSILAPDQLRQRVAFALSEIMVTSESGPLDERSDALTDYYDTLAEHAFGNFRDLLEAVTLHPAMGRYLDMLRNDKPNSTTGRIPNENYAREILQLFSIGLNRMWPDGSLMLNSKGEIIPTYDQDAIIGFSHAFTGWDYFYTGDYRTNLNASSNWTEPMREVPNRHYIGPKRLLNNVVIPGLPIIGGVVADPDASYSPYLSDPAFQALAARELDATHDAIFNHPNTGPFICRQLIQRLVTSTPSYGYVYRVVQKFNDNGSGVRGDMRAVIKAILLDYEARHATPLAQHGYGKQREPVARVTALARAFPAPAPLPGTFTQTGSVLTVTTATDPLLATGNSMYVEFTGNTGGDAGLPADAIFSIIEKTGAGPFTLTLHSKSRKPATYRQDGAMIAVLDDDDDGFAFSSGEELYIEYVDGSSTPPASGLATSGYRSSDERTLFFPVPGAESASYSQSSGSQDLVIASTAHGLTVGTSLHVNFASPTSGAAAGGVYAITAVTPDNFTITTADTPASSRSGTAFFVAAASAKPVVTGVAVVTRPADFANRSGTMAVTYGDWSMNSTDTDMNQTPMDSPTVFNFFLPDYQFPGELAQAGLVTPEFQLTSETSVIRQANFFHAAIFNSRSPGSTSGSANTLGTIGLSSFKNGGRDIVLDLRPWIEGTNNGLPWAHSNNIPILVDRLNTLLLAGQLPAAARTVIVSTVTNTSNFPYTTPGTPPSNTQLRQMRDRIRAVIHLIVTSPDFIIQK